MARIDKYEPRAGGFRAKLNAAFSDTDDVGVPLAVSLNASGRVVIGTAGQSGFVGIICLSGLRAAGDVVDVMTDGELADAGLAAGTRYFAAADGTLSTDDTDPIVGWTVEADRLVVRIDHYVTPAP